jgi:ankyrin repeat protein
MLAFASGFLLALAGSTAANTNAVAEACAAGERCGYEDRDRAQQEADEQQAALRRVLTMFASGEATPEADARSAAEAGDFRLIWSSGFGSLSVTGGHCRFPLSHPETQRSPFTLFTVSWSDAVDDSESGRAAAAAVRRLGDYALRYNRAMRTDPRFPYADLCAVQVETRRLRGLPGLGQPESLAPPSRVETDTPRNLGEAVRRGTLRALRRMLAGIATGALDRRDDFGLTPLAWALIDGRPDVARLLLGRGADPLGGCVAPWGEMEAMPLGIALLKGQRTLAGEMLTPAVRARLRPWPPALVLLVARGNHEALLREMLAEPDTDANIGPLLDAVVTSGSPALRREIAASSPAATATFLRLAVWRGDPSLLREALALRPSLEADSHGRRSPLGYAVVTESAAVDENVRLLLAAGAPVDSAADWGRNGFEVGSPVPTALFALTAYALRTDPARPRAENAPRIGAERRALELLLAAGASVGGTDTHGRPLAVILVTGRFGAAMAMPYPLPEGWLDRLIQAGMDVNAPWRGSTALDWAEAAGMTDAARELERAGGRRLRPATRREGRLN